MRSTILLIVSIIVTISANDLFRSSYSNGELSTKIAIQREKNSSNSIRYSYKIDNVEVVNSISNGYDSLSLGNVDYTAHPGEPAIPYLEQRIIIPVGMVIDSISLSPVDSTVQKSDQPIQYATTPIIPGFEETTITEQDNALYSADLFYPAPLSEIVTVQVQSGVTVLYSNLYPVRYNPMTSQIITYTEFNTTIHLSPERVSRSSSLPAYPERVNPHDLDVENPEDLQHIRSRSGSQGEGEYVIITSKEIADAVAPYTINDLAAQRKAQGLTVKIVTTDSIYATTEGVDNPQKIRFFLREAYANWGTQYVLIAGDTEIVPVRILSPDVNKPDMPMETYVDSITAFVPSDFYYQCLDGPYNAPNWFDKTGQYWGRKDGGNYTGMVDISPELFIGRVPAENSIELSNWIKKQFTYESIPHSDPRFSNIFMAGEHIGFGNPGGIMEFAKNCLNEIRFSSSEGDYTTKGFDALEGITVDTIFDEDRGLENRWGFDEIKTAINTDKYALLQHLGHGLEHEYMHITLSNVSELTNSTPYFSYSQACLPGRFTNDCIGEELLTGNDTSGVWGGIFNTGFGRGSTNSTDGISQRINRNFWDGYFRADSPITRVGELNSHSHASVFNRIKFPGYLYGIFAISVFGDPYSEIKLARPAAEQFLYVTAPTASRPLRIGKENTITWNSSLTGDLQLSLLDESGAITDLGSALAEQSELLWTPSADLSLDTKYRVIAVAGDLADTSEQFQLIDANAVQLLNPTNGDLFNKGETVSVEWVSEAPVSIWVRRNGVIIEQLCEGLVDNTLQWELPRSTLSSDQYEILLISDNFRDSTFSSGMFTILPGMENVFPHIETFDDLTLGDTLRGFWEQGFLDDNQWLIHTGKTPTKSSSNPKAILTGPSSDFTTSAGAQDGNYIYVEATGNSPQKQFDLLSPRFDLRGATGSELSFALHMYSDSLDHMGVFSIDIICEGRDTVTEFEQIGRFDSDSWNEITVPLDMYDGEIIQIRFRGVTGKSYSSDIALDDITISVQSQDAVGILDQTDSYSRGSELFAIPAVATIDSPVITLHSQSSENGRFRVMLFDPLGNVITEKVGYLDPSSTEITTLDFRSLSGITGRAYLVVIERVNDEGKATYSRALIGVKR